MNSLKAKLPPLGTLGPAIALVLACAFFSFQHENFLTLGNFSLIPPVAGAGIGGLLGFMKSKRDGAGARGAVTAAGAGLGAGTALSLGNSFLQTPVGEAMRKEQGLLTMLGLLGVGAAGAHFGIQGGRGLADKLGLPAYNRTHGSEDDLTELDPATHASLLPGSLKKLLQTR